MKRIKYLFKCVCGMNFGRMLRTVRRLAGENNKLSIVVLLDILWCGIRYGAGYVDYQIFDFAKLSGRQRKTFVTRGINNDFIRKLNNRDDYSKFEDKSVFNTLFGEFIGREWLVLSGSSSDSGDDDGGGSSLNNLQSFSEFVERNPVFIAKPIDAICGKGIEKIDVNSNGGDVRSLYGKLVENRQLLIEECVVQHGDLSAVNASSVNTVRFMTIVSADSVHVMFRALRVGIAGSVVDNFNAGGMFVLLDENGVIISDAINKNTDVFERHPSTDVVFKGTKIPFFREALELVECAARVVSGVRYVSWDVAITPTGPVLIEGNHNPGYDLLQSKVYLLDNEYGRLEDFKKVIG